jgi:cell wall-associated NlpC family hydrolase
MRVFVTLISAYFVLFAVVRLAHATSRTERAVKYARRVLGTPYVWGGQHPGGFDCSGLVWWVYHRLGISLARTTYGQWRQGRRVLRRNLRPGDVVFFHPGSEGPSHEGLYIGNGRFIEAPHSGSSVRVASLRNRNEYVGARRFRA